MATKLKEIQPIGGPRPRSVEDKDNLWQRRAEWEQSLTLPFAGDFIGAAIVAGAHLEAMDAARFVLNDNNATKASESLAKRVLPSQANAEDEAFVGDPDPGRAGVYVHLNRSRLTDDPRNALAWSDLSLAYAILGHTKRSLRAMRAALSLAPDNRFVLRSAARLFVHLKDFELAHATLVGSDRTPHDPWLLAAEIAVASGADRRSHFVKKGRVLVESQSMRPWDVSELASALGTLEFEDGNTKKSKRLLTQSLRDPSENAVAQAEWLAERIPSFAFQPSLFDVPNSFEAQARYYAEDGDWNPAIWAAKQWHADQPFAGDAATFGSYVAAIGIQDYELSAEFARQGLVANATDIVLRNNLAFALASLGRADEARAEFQLIDLHRATPEERAVIRATAGTILYRRGALDEGRAAYMEALDGLRSEESNHMKVMAALMWAREELLAGSVTSFQTLDLASRLAKGSQSRETQLWLSLLEGLSVRSK